MRADLVLFLMIIPFRFKENLSDFNLLLHLNSNHFPHLNHLKASKAQTLLFSERDFQILARNTAIKARIFFSGTGIMFLATYS